MKITASHLLNEIAIKCDAFNWQTCHFIRVVFLYKTFEELAVTLLYMIKINKSISCHYQEPYSKLRNWDQSIHLSLVFPRCMPVLVDGRTYILYQIYIISSIFTQRHISSHFLCVLVWSHNFVFGSEIERFRNWNNGYWGRDWSNVHGIKQLTCTLIYASDIILHKRIHLSWKDINRRAHSLK